MSRQFSGKDDHYPARGGGVVHANRYLPCVLVGLHTVSAMAIGLVRLMALQIIFPLTIDRIVTMVNAANGNQRLGIYADNGDTPAGGALLGESASVAAILNKNELAIGPLSLPAGLYWIAHQNDDGTLNLDVLGVEESSGGTIQDLSFNQVYGAFQNPCPAVGATTLTPDIYVRVASVP